LGHPCLVVGPACRAEPETVAEFARIQPPHLNSCEFSYRPVQLRSCSASRTYSFPRCRFRPIQASPVAGHSGGLLGQTGRVCFDSSISAARVDHGSVALGVPESDATRRDFSKSLRFLGKSQRVRLSGELQLGSARRRRIVVFSNRPTAMPANNQIAVLGRLRTRSGCARHSIRDFRQPLPFTCLISRRPRAGTERLKSAGLRRVCGF
jgi:hypothetical protein